MSNEKKSILVIEDDIAQQKFYKMVLESEDYEVALASSIEEAIPFLDSRVYDLYIVDAILNSGESGTTLIDTSYRPMLIISGLEFENLESVRSLQKPISIELLKKTVHNMIYGYDL